MLVAGGEPSSEDAIETDGLTKCYEKSNVCAIDDLRLRVRRGQVYGLLGPNCAGKTTALRMLVGLQPTSGTARLFGRAPGSPGSLTGVGAMIERRGSGSRASGRAPSRCGRRPGRCRGQPGSPRGGVSRTCASTRAMPCTCRPLDERAGR
jgi:energy-coupling factor transporter ATP-binding protein EcfA2